MIGWIEVGEWVAVVSKTGIDGEKSSWLPRLSVHWLREVYSASSAVKLGD